MLYAFLGNRSQYYTAIVYSYTSFFWTWLVDIDYQSLHLPNPRSNGAPYRSIFYYQGSCSFAIIRIITMELYFIFREMVLWLKFLFLLEDYLPIYDLIVSMKYKRTDSFGSTVHWFQLYWLLFSSSLISVNFVKLSFLDTSWCISEIL